MKNLIELPTEKEIRSAEKQQAATAHDSQRIMTSELPKRVLPKRRINPRLLIL